MLKTPSAYARPGRAEVRRGDAAFFVGLLDPAIPTEGGDVRGGLAYTYWELLREHDAEVDTPLHVLTELPQGVVTGRIYEGGWVGVRVQVPMEGRRLLDLPKERVLRQEPPELRIEVAGLGVVEAGFGVEEVPGEGEAVGGVGELVRESEVAPGIEVVGGDGSA